MQAPYRATSMDFLTDYSKYASKPFIPVNPSAAAGSNILNSLDTLVVVNNELPSDATGRNPAAADYFQKLRDFVLAGGNLVLTDGAIRALGRMNLFDGNAVRFGQGYVGYVDIQDHNHPFTKGLPPAARQTYDPITLGYQLRIERDGHWAGNPESGTANMAPIWMVDRAAWEKAGGVTIATSDPLSQPKSAADEGTATDKVSVGTIKFGKGRVVFIGALLPDPTDKYPHWFGLGSYGVTFTGHYLFSQSITYSAPDRAPLSATEAATTLIGAGTGLPTTARAAASGSSPAWAVGLAGAALVTGLGVLGRRRRRLVNPANTAIGDSA